VIGVPSRTTVPIKHLLLDIAGKCMDQVMLVTETFAVAYEQKKMLNSIMVDIGAGTTDFCAMKGRIPDTNNQLTINKAGDYVDLILVDAIKDDSPEVSVSAILAKKLKEQFGTVLRPKRKIITSLRTNGIVKNEDITDAMVYSCSIIVPDILEGIKKMILTFEPEFEDEVLQNITLAGGMSQVNGLPTVIEGSLKDLGQVKVHSPKAPLYSGAEGALSLGKSIPIHLWEKIGIVE
jgi:rod shape-determining protein MreB and related proteins